MKGFTLIELVIVIAVAGMLLAVILPALDEDSDKFWLGAQPVQPCPSEGTDPTPTPTANPDPSWR